jgi:hypothetical protein
MRDVMFLGLAAAFFAAAAAYVRACGAVVGPGERHDRRAGDATGDLEVDA